MWNIIVPSHPADLEVTKVRPVFLLVFSRELWGKELHRTHTRIKQVEMMLRKVTAADWDFKKNIAAVDSWTHIRSRPFLVTWPDKGFKSPVRSFILERSQTTGDSDNVQILHRWFSCSVSPNHGYPWIKANIEVHRPQKNFVWCVSESNFISLEQWWWYFVGFWKPWTNKYLSSEIVKVHLLEGFCFFLLRRLKIRQLWRINGIPGK